MRRAGHQTRTYCATSTSSSTISTSMLSTLWVCNHNVILHRRKLIPSSVTSVLTSLPLNGERRVVVWGFPPPSLALPTLCCRLRLLIGVVPSLAKVPMPWQQATTPGRHRKTKRFSNRRTQLPRPLSSEIDSRSEIVRVWLYFNGSRLLSLHFQA